MLLFVLLNSTLVSENSSMVQFFVCLISPWIADLDIQIPPWWGIIGGIGGGIGGIGGGDDSMRFLQTSNATNSTNSTGPDIGIGDIIDAIEGIGELYDPEVCRITGASIMCCIYGGRFACLGSISKYWVLLCTDPELINWME